MSKPYSETYGDYLIEYSLDKNKWVVTLGGVHVSNRDSLLNARKAVEDENKAKNEFDRHPVFFREGYGSEAYKRAEVTGYAEPSYGRTTREVWISISHPHGKPTRNKVCVENLYENTTENESVLAELVSLQQAEETIQRRKHEAVARLKKYTFRKCPHTTPKV